MKAKYLINPFERIAGFPALLLGLCIMSLTAVLGRMNNIYFDGALDIHFSRHSYSQAFMAQAVNIFTVFVVMWLLGVLFSKSKVRAIDVAGTMALSRAPLLLPAILGFLPIVPENMADTSRLILFTIPCMIVVVWMIALMYHAFSVSCYLKGVKATIIFITGVFLSEAISKCIFIFLLSGLWTTTIENIPDDFAMPAGQTIQQNADDVFHYLKDGKYKHATAYFDNKMKEQVSDKKLMLLWNGIQQQFGQFESFDTSQPISKLKDYDILLVPCTFEQGSVNIQLTFNQSGQISGLFLR